MKNRIFIFSVFLVLVLASGYFLSCEKESLKGTSLQGVTEILSKYNAQLKPYEKPATLQVGEVKIIAANNEIYLTLDVPGNDMLAEYLLQVKEIPAGLKSEDLGTSEVLFLDNNLVVNSLDFKDRTYRFQLPSSGGEFVSNIVFNNAFVGYGITERIFGRGIQLRAPPCRCLEATADFSSCDSGGIGSTSCSTSTSSGSCSTTCEGGLTYQTYACCKNN